MLNHNRRRKKWKEISKESTTIVHLESLLIRITLIRINRRRALTPSISSSMFHVFLFPTLSPNPSDQILQRFRPYLRSLDQLIPRKKERTPIFGSLHGRIERIDRAAVLSARICADPEILLDSCSSRRQTGGCRAAIYRGRTQGTSAERCGVYAALSPVSTLGSMASTLEPPWRLFHVHVSPLRVRCTRACVCAPTPRPCVWRVRAPVPHPRVHVRVFVCVFEERERERIEGNWKDEGR